MVLTQERLELARSNGSNTPSASDQRPLYRLAGIAAALAAILTPITIAVYATWPPPYDEGAVKWFELLQDNPVLGLASLDLLFVAVNVLMIPVMLTLYLALRGQNPSLMTLSIVTFFVGLAAFFATNPSIEMLSLSNSYAGAATDAERMAIIGAGEGLLAGFEGTAFHLNYILAQLAGIAIGIVMLKSESFNRSIAWLMIVGNTVGFGLYLPVIGLHVSAFSGAILWIWMIAMARAFFRLARTSEAGRNALPRTRRLP